MTQQEALMQLLSNLVGPFIAISVVWVLLRVTVYRLAAKDQLFTFREEGLFKYLMRGKTLVKIIYKLKDHYVDQKTGKVIYQPGTGNEQWSLSEWILGAKWIGIVPNQILIYEVHYDREPKTTDPEKPDPKNPEHKGYSLDKDYNIMHRSTLTNFHFFRQVYPIVAKGVELSDRVKVDIIGTFTIETFNAYKPVIELRGNWFGHVRDAAEGAMNDWARQLSLPEFTAAQKASGAKQSDLEKAILTSKETDSGTIATTGMGIVAFNFKEWRLTADKDIEEASRAKRLEELRGEARVVKAKSQATAIREVGTARASAAGKYVEEVAKHPVGAQALISQNISTAISEHQGTLVLGSPNTMLSVEGSSQPQQNQQRGGNQGGQGRSRGGQQDQGGQNPNTQQPPENNQ